MKIMVEREDLEYILEHIESGNPNWAINRLEEMLEDE